MTKKRLHGHLKDHLIPHEGNNFKPLLFTAAGVGAVILLLLLVQIAYFVQTRIVFTQTDFLASVLPGVLATLTNEDRTNAGIQALTEDAHLARAAQMKAEDMAAKGYFAHVDPEGRQPWYWFKQAGYDYTYAGENLAVNFTDSQDVEEAWMNSPTHHANIVKAQYTRIGIGVAKGVYKGEETTFVVQFFATPRAVAAPTPEPEPVFVSEEPTAVAITEPDQPDTQVLGVEVGTVMPESPEELPMLETEYEANVQAEAAKSPMEEASAPALSFFAQVASSPTHTVIYILAGLAALISVLLFIALAAHLRVQYLEVAGGGLLVVMVALSLLVFNATSLDGVEIPDSSQPASVVSAF